ncbi:M1 family aminopeptidase [candidate division KSB1 bacterium]
MELGFSEKGFWVPTDPPRARYTLDYSIEYFPEQSLGKTEGSGIIHLKNTTSKALSRLAFDWSINKYQTLEIKADGEKVPIAGYPDQTSYESPILIILPASFLPEQELELELEFGQTMPIPKEALPDRFRLTGWYPKLWWGFDTFNDYDVKIRILPGYTLGTSGRWDSNKDCYTAEGVSSFGIYLGKDHQIIEGKTDDVLIRCLFPPERNECAEIILDTAIDVINHHREYFGFYPFMSLTIVPGAKEYSGGYPVATSLIAIHGQWRLEEQPELFWRQITAHEIGHQYWGEYVLDKDWNPWLWIGLGFYADMLYDRAKGYGPDKHIGIIERYVEGVKKKYDTTVSISPDQMEKLDFDFNNVVIHGKSYSIISALSCILGDKTFYKIYHQCLRERAGRRLGVSEFQNICEQVSGQDLDWFFRQWVYSNRFLSYEIASQECKKANDQFITDVQVNCIGTLKMPVPVAAFFQDGTEQLKFTDRLLDVNHLLFESDALLTRVKIDPGGKLPLVIPPPS